jgi:hypothetical protein
MLKIYATEVTVPIEAYSAGLNATILLLNFHLRYPPIKSEYDVIDLSIGITTYGSAQRSAGDERQNMRIDGFSVARGRFIFEWSWFGPFSVATAS